MLKCNSMLVRKSEHKKWGMIIEENTSILVMYKHISQLWRVIKLMDLVYRLNHICKLWIMCYVIMNVMIDRRK